MGFRSTLLHALSIAVLSGAAAGSPQVELHPRVAESDTGSWTLTVRPLLGKPGAHMEVRQEDWLAWERDVAFELEDAFVTSRGFVAGFLHDLRGVTEERPLGRLLVAGFRADGLQVLDATVMVPSHWGCMSSGETARGIVASEDANAVLVWTSRKRVLSFRLDDGAVLEPVEMRAALDSPGVFRFSDVRPISGTPYFAVHSLLHRTEASLQERSRFDLVDASFRSVWRLDLPRDFAMAHDPANPNEYHRVLSLVEREHFLRVDGPHVFAVRSVASHEWIRIGVGALLQASGETLPDVRELGREPDPLPIQF